MNQLLLIIEILGAVPGMFFALIKILKKGEEPPSRILGFALLSYASMLLLIFLGRAAILDYSKSLIMVSNTSVAVSWPLFYIYISFITARKKKLSTRDLIHAVPCTLYLFIFIFPLVIADSLPTFFHVFSFIYIFIISVYYSIMMLVSLYSYDKMLDNYYSEQVSLRMSWLKATVFIWLAIIMLQLFFVPFQQLLSSQYPSILLAHAVLINLASVSWIYLFAYFALSHPHIFSHSRDISEKLEPEEEEETKEEDKPQPLVNDDYADIIASRLAKVMKEKKPYLDDQLTIATLADMITVPPYLLGRYLNSRLDKNFMTYINEHRIEEVKKKLKDPQYADITILEISAQSGFRTKSAFNNFFRKSVGMTPTQFRNSH